MRLLINSDRLFATYLISERLPASLAKICTACAEKGITVVLPETAILEFNRAQKKLADQEINKILSAYTTLERYGIELRRVDPGELVHQPNMVEMIQKLEVEVEVIPPTIEDFQEAHRRACLHEAPQPPETKSDEMRDLLIWMIALRQAKQHGGAVLLSGDEVHVHSRGNKEADAVALIRVETVEEVLEILEIETPAGQLICQLLAAVWQDLIDCGLPLSPNLEIRGVTEAAFVQGGHGLAAARFSAKLTGMEKRQIQAKFALMIEKEAVTKIEVKEYAIDGERQAASFNLTVHRPVTLMEEDLGERMAALIDVLEVDNESTDG
jgi:hypothetical protein